jgi:chorismate synthase
MLPDIKINAYVSCRPYFLEKPYQELDFSKQKVILRCPDEESAIMEEYIREIRARRYSRGTVTCVIQNVPIGLESLFCMQN